MSKEEGYDPRRSKVSDNTMAQWRQRQVTGDLNEVPGIGAAAIKKLGTDEIYAERITNTYQLFGKFLMLKGPGEDGEDLVPCAEHTDKFWHYLKNKGISAHRSGIVKAIAEKSATFFAGIYDESVFDEENENEKN